ncbi:hypothetical protein JYU34_009691 [Plutella xylostella]|uniref:Uncharacterized protein n=1 Tax=Plutella xylostella TaxID=51655 RepID=A0ABQ7QK80_PLUXY|nr:hypothetical protein JYU34_009691 [Plutella xylostella]
MYGSQGGEELPRYAGSPQRQASPFPLESMNRRYYRRNRNSKGEEVFTAETSTLARRPRRDEFVPDARNGRHGIANGAATGSERSCDSPPEPAPPEVPPRGPSLHVTLRHRPAQPEPPTDADRLYLSEGQWDVSLRVSAHISVTYRAFAFANSRSTG